MEKSLIYSLLYETYNNEHKYNLLNQEEWNTLSLDDKINILDVAIKKNITIDEILNEKKEKIKIINIK